MPTAHAIPISRTVYTEHKIHIIECARCSIDFGIGDDFMRRRREDHGGFYCPNGHSNVYRGDNAEERAVKERDAARDLARREADRRRRAEAEARTLDYQRRAAKGQLTKLRNRIANGVCPCCSRSFENVHRHIQSQHPDFVMPDGVNTTEENR